MAKLKWDSVGERVYEYGVDRGVLYVKSMNYGVVWNGLINVKSSTLDERPESFYIDGFKYYNEPKLQDYTANIEAYTYPEAFSKCEGVFYNANGLGFDTQKQETFGLSYRTMVGSDSPNDQGDYIIHLVYNALATPSSRGYSTSGESAEPSTFTWDIITSPIIIPGMMPVSHFLIDTRKVKSDTVEQIEKILYGTSTKNARMLTETELIKLVDDWAGFRILPAPSGISILTSIGEDDLIGNTDVGIFEKSANSRLTPTETPGLNTLRTE